MAKTNRAVQFKCRDIYGAMLIQAADGNSGNWYFFKKWNETELMNQAEGAVHFQVSFKTQQGRNKAAKANENYSPEPDI